MSCSTRLKYLRRRRGILLGVAMAAGVCGGIVFATSSKSSTTQSDASVSTRAPDLIVARVTDLGTLETNREIRGRDGGYSAVFQGHEVWIYGDTWLAHTNEQKRGLISNSWSFGDAPGAGSSPTGFHERVDRAGEPAMLLPETPEEQAFNDSHNGDHCRVKPCGARFALWPGTIVADTERDRALIFYTLISAAPGDFNFHGLGSGVAIWRNFAEQPQRPTISPGVAPDHPELLFGQNELNFGSSALINGATLYAFACEKPGLEKPCRLGRVDPAKVLDRSAWSFYAGAGKWSAHMGDAAEVFSGNDIMNVSFNPFLQRYVAVYSQVLSTNVMMRTARSIEGPWSDEVKIFTTMHPREGGNVYDAQAHPEYNTEGGRVMVVTYSRSTGPFASEVRVVAVELRPR